MKNALNHQGVMENTPDISVSKTPSPRWFAQLHRLHPDLILLPIGWDNECIGEIND